VAAGRTVVIAALAGLVASGCANAPGPAARPSPADPRRSPAAAAARAGAAAPELPVEAYGLSELQTGQANYLTLRLLQVCAARFGVRYPPGLSPSNIALGVRIQQEIDSRRYGVSDPAAARVYGYHAPSWMTGPVKPAKISLLPPAQQRVLWGGNAHPAASSHIPAGGCEGQASRELAAAGIGGPAQQNGAALIEQINVQGFQQAQSDPRVRAVFAKWSACMRSHGYDYGTPLQAGGSPAWNLSAPPTRTEIRAAETDVACKQQADVLGVTFTAESDAERALIARQARALAQARAATEMEAQGIQRLLAEYGT